ncbi:MAG: FAD-binding oxidoreductase [Steroidobacteraceae bacterium]
MNIAVSSSLAPDEFIGSLRDVLGPDNVLTDDAERRFFGQDVHDVGPAPLAVARPPDIQAVQAVVRACAAHGVALLPRGGGMSYTRGYLGSGRAAICLDLSALDRVLEVSTTDGFVTVECGVTWKALDAYLEPHGLRVPSWGTLSGIRATVGGGLSQGAMFMGAARHGPVADSLLGLDVVLADGSLARLGAHAKRSGTPFFRQFGPDFSAAFTGDCGALGVKVTASLRLIPRLPATAYLSAGFDAVEPMLEFMCEVGRRGLVTESFGFDAGMQRVRLKRARLAEGAQALGKVAGAAGGGLRGVKAAAKVALSGRGYLDEVAASLHLCLDEPDTQAADRGLDKLRGLLDGRGREVPSSMPRVLRATPFGEVNSMLGPDGEKWVPVHGTVPFSQAVEAYRAIRQWFDDHAEDCAALDVEYGNMFCVVGDRGILIEPVFYWPDAREAFHERVMTASHLATLRRYERNPAARDLVMRLRKGTAEVLQRHGAVHFQIGRYYEYLPALDPSANQMLRAFKHLVDPQNIMNPGVLGLD